MMQEKIVITIDGPAGAGKTTVSKRLAEVLGYRYVDTGALYRGVAFEAVSSGVASDDDAGLENLCRTLELNLVRSDKGLRLISGGRDISDLIRTPEMSLMASAVSARPVVREFLLGLQRKLGNEKGVVFEGRDMGTVVFPEAEMKFFLDATPKVRAYRRYLELKEQKQVTLEEVEQDMNLRDANDSTRDIAPLVPADDAVRIDATTIHVDDVINKMMFYINNLNLSSYA